MPVRRSPNEMATTTPSTTQFPPRRVTPAGIEYRRSAGSLPGMAKAKRRKLRARRKKANHGRKPNAGRG
jgi:hypothetical protein